MKMVMLGMSAGLMAAGATCIFFGSLLYLDQDGPQTALQVTPPVFTFAISNDHKPVVAEFTIKNPNRKRVDLVDVHTSCTCAGASIATKSLPAMGTTGITIRITMPEQMQQEEDFHLNSVLIYRIHGDSSLYSTLLEVRGSALITSATRASAISSD